MDVLTVDDGVRRRIRAMVERIEGLMEHDLYFYNQPITELRGGSKVLVNNRKMSMFASYSYLGLVGHPRIYGIQRVAILDWDVHHGNGTQEIFYEDDSVLYMSLHQYPLYPGTGAAGERGRGKGLGATVNCPLASGER